MNVIVSNKKKQMFENLNIEIIKELNGEFDVEEIIDNFKNFFFQRLILDITALRDYNDIRTIQKLSLALDMNKVILVLDETSNTVSPEYMSKLISLGIYNFTTNLEGVMYLYNSPNSYRDVAHLHMIEHSVASPQPSQSTPQPQVGGYSNVDYGITNRVIGFQNVTRQSGATTLVYMLKKVLSKKYTVAAIEVDKSDFKFFNDNELISTSNSSVAQTINSNKGKSAVLVDLNGNENAMALCDDVIYLIEPSIIKLNKLMLINPKGLERVKGKKVVLNQSLISSRNVSDFEYETGLKIYHTLPALNDRSDYIPELSVFLEKLGFSGLS